MLHGEREVTQVCIFNSTVIYHCIVRVIAPNLSLTVVVYRNLYSRYKYHTDKKLGKYTHVSPISDSLFTNFFPAQHFRERERERERWAISSTCLTDNKQAKGKSQVHVLCAYV